MYHQHLTLNSSPANNETHEDTRLLVQKNFGLMDLEGSLTCSQESATGRILSHLNSVYNVTPHVFKIHFNIIILPNFVFK
jgi:hypothetical protein